MHRKLKILEKTGYAVLRDYGGPAIPPGEWEQLEYLDWKSGGDTNFAPIATADEVARVVAGVGDGADAPVH